MDDACARALAYLRECRVMTLATYGSDGVSAAALFYASEGFTLHFLSAPTTRHVRNLALHPRVAVTVQKDYGDWNEIRGLQLEGVAAEADAAEAARVRNVYAAKFPLVARIGEAPPAMAAAFARVRFYSVVAERARFVDNSRGFGHRDEIDVRSLRDPRRP